MSALDVRAIDAGELRKQPAPAAKQEFRIFLSEAAFDRAVARGDNDTTREIGGVLVGDLLRDDAGPYLRIDATIDALHAEEKGAELTFTHATWEHIHKEMDSLHHDKRVVGWYHTHPGFGVFLSDRDQFIHRSFFNLPFQVALVYDPKSHEHGVFAWHDNEVWRARRYWIGAREQMWDGLRGPVDAKKLAPATPAAPAASIERDDRGDSARREEPAGTVAMFIVIGTILALLGGIVGHWWATGRAGQALAEAQIAVAEAKADGAKAGIAMLQTDLLGILRDTYSDETMHRPVLQAIETIDQIIAAMPPELGVLGPVPPAAAGSDAQAPSARETDARWGAFAQQLRIARTRLMQFAQARATAQAELATLAASARRGSDVPREIAHDLAEQRSGLGAMYAELATDAAKAGDRDRARRLLAAAAHLDPGNRSRYEKQLQAFDPTGHLAPDGPRLGAPGEGEPR